MPLIEKPLSVCRPQSVKSRLEPTTKFLTVLETTTSPGASERAPPGGNLHCDARNIVSRQLDFARAEPDADFHAKTAHAVANRTSTVYGPRRLSKVARKPWPAVLISCPRKRASSLRTSA